MTDLVLPDGRRKELAALLDDDQRLRAEYPTVAEYLDMAPQLQGTGDDRADAAFDLRFVHYVTGGSNQSANPYWEIVAPSVSVHDGRRIVDGGRVSGSARLAYAHMSLQAIYAYAVPSPETLDWVARFCVGRPVIEPGAGRGYWAAQLTAVGLTVDAYDAEPPGAVQNVSFPSTPGQQSVWHRVDDMNGYAARINDCAACVLFLCWPPGWGSNMASQSLMDFERGGGNRLVFVGEQRGGKTGDDAFFDRLEAGWRLESEDDQYVSWWNQTDVAQGWVKR